MNQTRRNLTTEYLSLNFVTSSKLTSFFVEKVLISCVWQIPVSLFRTTSRLFRYRYFAAYPFEFKVFNQTGNHRYFQPVEKKKCFAWENTKEVVEGLGNGSFVTVTSFAPLSSSAGKLFSNNLQDFTPHVKGKWENF